MEQKFSIPLMGLILFIVLGVGYVAGERHLPTPAPLPAGPSMSASQGVHMMPDGAMMENGGTSMQGMMDDMSGDLRGKTGDEFDKAFLDEMIVHHQGAIDMAKQVQATSKRPELLKLASDIITAQTEEIEMMKTWRSSWFATSP